MPGFRSTSPFRSRIWSAPNIRMRRRNWFRSPTPSEVCAPFRASTFTKIFEAVSLVEKELQADPAGVYGHSDFATRDQCRRVVERISRSQRDDGDRGGPPRRPPGGRSAGPAHADRHAVPSLRRRSPSWRRRPIRTSRCASGWSGGCADTPRPFIWAAIIVLTVSFLTLALVLAWEGGAHQKIMLAVLGALALFPAQRTGASRSSTRW